MRLRRSCVAIYGWLHCGQLCNLLAYINSALIWANVQIFILYCGTAIPINSLVSFNCLTHFRMAHINFSC